MGCAFNANQFFLGGSSALKDGFRLICRVGLFATTFALMAGIISHRHKIRFRQFVHIKPGGLLFYAAARMNHHNGRILFGFVEVFRSKKFARQFNAIAWDLDTLFSYLMFCMAE